jgi:hypothetical protein
LQTSWKCICEDVGPEIPDVHDDGDAPGRSISDCGSAKFLYWIGSKDNVRRGALPGMSQKFVRCILMTSDAPQRHILCIEPAVQKYDAMIERQLDFGRNVIPLTLAVVVDRICPERYIDTTLR